MTAEDLPNPGQLVVSKRFKTLYSIFIFIGLAGFVVTFINDQQRAWEAYLLGFFYFMTLALGGLFFTCIQHLTKAGWSVNIRRICEAFMSFIPLGAVLALIFLVGAPHLYHWLHSDVTDPLILHKKPYLNQTFFIIRLVGYFGIWWFISRKMIKNSTEQDKDGNEKWTVSNLKLSVPTILLFALTYTFFSIDTLMSLEPHWFSTIFGVYTFAGLFQSTMAAMILVLIYLKGKGHLSGYVDENHFHDLGKFLFAFTVFWAYIAFSQFMLIWYANLPEETIFYDPRMKGSWATVSVLMIVFKFIVPFIALLPQWAKRNTSHLGAISILVLIMQAVDLYWLIYPNFHEDAGIFMTEVLVFLGFLGLFMFTVSRFLSSHPLVPTKDPYIQESIHHHVVY